LKQTYIFGYTLVLCFLPILVFVTSFVPTVDASGVGRSEADALMNLWQKHVQNTSAHKEMINECLRFRNRYRRSGLTPFVETLAGWHYFKQNDWEKGRELFSNLTVNNSGTLAKAAQRMSNRWLTRLKHKQVISALNRYYAQYIQFPEKLSQLKELDNFDTSLLKDNFGKAWVYKPKNVEFLESSAPQDYLLYSAVLEKTTSLTKFLDVSYGKDMALKAAEKVDNSNSGQQVLRFETSQDVSPVLTPGNRYKNTTYVKEVSNFVLLSNGDFWDIIEIKQNL